MDKILIKETKTVHELIIKAIASCRKDDDGFVDCMNVGKSIAYEGYCFEHKLSDIICREEYLFETKVIQKRWRYYSCRSSKRRQKRQETEYT